MEGTGEPTGIVDGGASTNEAHVFISHDARDAELAKAVAGLLRKVSSGFLKAFRSSSNRPNEGIEFGDVWFSKIMERLQGADHVICLLTRRSLNRPWILFEAGVAKGKLDVPVHGIAFGVPLSEAATGPFALFQNCADGAEELTELMFQLMEKLSGADPDRSVIEGQVAAFLQEVKKMGYLAESNPKNEAPRRPAEATAKIFEEVKIMFQDLSGRLRTIENWTREKRLIEEPVRADASRRSEAIDFSKLVMSFLTADSESTRQRIARRLFESRQSEDPTTRGFALRAIERIESEGQGNQLRTALAAMEDPEPS